MVSVVGRNMLTELESAFYSYLWFCWGSVCINDLICEKPVFSASHSQLKKRQKKYAVKNFPRFSGAIVKKWL